MAELSLAEIRRFWTDQAKQHGQSPFASWSDHPVIHMEIREIMARLADGDQVLDIGCANGYSTVQFASQRRIRILGLDYIPEMIEQARARLAALPALSGSVEFHTGDITALDQPSGAWDKVVVIRVVINLGDWERQLAGLRECARVLKPGGTLLLSEATVQGWRKLNQFRAEWGLAEIPVPGFNTYLDEERVAEAMGDCMELVEIANFASSYYVGTRVLKPLAAKMLAFPMDTANPAMHWNEWFAQLPAAGDYGTQKLFVMRKK